MSPAVVPVERLLENYLITACSRHHLLCLKMASPGRRGVPDRLIIGHDDRSDPVVLFVELKRPGGVPRPSQRAMFARMRAHGAHVVIVDSPVAVDMLIEDYFLRTPQPIAQRDPQTANLPGKAPITLVLDRGRAGTDPTPKKEDPPCT